MRSLLFFLFLVILGSCKPDQHTDTFCEGRKANLNGFDLVYEKDLSDVVRANTYFGSKLLTHKDLIIYCAQLTRSISKLVIVNKNTGALAYDFPGLFYSLSFLYIYNGHLYFQGTPPSGLSKEGTYILDLESFTLDSLKSADLNVVGNFIPPSHTVHPMTMISDYNSINGSLIHKFHVVDVKAKSVLATFTDTADADRPVLFYTIWGNSNAYKITYLSAYHYNPNDNINGHYLITRDINTGELLYQIPMPIFLNRDEHKPMLVEGNTMYLGFGEVRFMIDLPTGRTIWKDFPTSIVNYSILSSGKTMLYNNIPSVSQIKVFMKSTGQNIDYFNTYKMSNENPGNIVYYCGESPSGNIFVVNENNELKLLMLDKSTGCPISLSNQTIFDGFESATYDEDSGKIFLVSNKRLYCFKPK